MSETTIDFIERLVVRYPGLKPLFDEHVSDNFGEVLPHLFFGDLTRYALALFADVQERTDVDTQAESELRRLLNDLEDAYADAQEEIQELISVSFLENLPRPGEARSGVRTWLGPELSTQLDVIG